jgi:hypothetical protein
MPRAETWNAPERGNPDELNAARVRAARTTQVGRRRKSPTIFHIAERFVKRGCTSRCERCSAHSNWPRAALEKPSKPPGVNEWE